MSKVPGPVVLSYQTPQKNPREAPFDQVWATALSLPGVCGFCLLAGALLMDSRLAWKIGPHAGIFIWAVAFICAVLSFFYFRGRPKTAWVKFCLTLNWIGVAFTVTPPGWIVLLLAIGAHQ